jgi:hypothetical protein
MREINQILKLSLVQKYKRTGVWTMHIRVFITVLIALEQPGFDYMQMT